MTNTDLIKKLKNLSETISLKEPNAEYSRDEAAALYIKYTGACLTGVEEFINRFSPETVFTINDILQITKNEEYSTKFVDQMLAANVENAKNYIGSSFKDHLDFPDAAETATLDKDRHSVSIYTRNNLTINQKNSYGTIEKAIALNIEVNIDTNTELIIKEMSASESVLIYSQTSKYIGTADNSIIKGKTIRFSSNTCATTNLDLSASEHYAVSVASIGSVTLKLHTAKPISFGGYGLKNYGKKNLTVRYPRGTKIRPTGQTSAISIDKSNIDDVNGIEANVDSGISGTIVITCDL
ncbi:hypothetical protein [Leuconostoc falkenbergense]|uniref:hypothetical protein n=1 Tax=Leuconostoc falkenbergense TaxID=2766470 RepID=UPI0028A8E0F8|nr:hypothetical protein [Leuconostoc falkenbergense]